MILVDTSVWIDFLRGTPTPQAEWLDRHLGIEPIVIGDLILAEVLQGFRHDKGFEAARRLFAPLAQLQIGGSALAVEAARNCRRLRAAGFTVVVLLVAGVVILTAVLGVTVWVAWRLGVRVGETVGALLRTPPGR